MSRPGGESSTVALGALLFGSGLCALIYQAVWLRQFRLIFGASTLASAAVLAIFMAGLGIGALKLGRLVDRSRNPLAFYGLLEVGVAVSAAATPLLLWIVSSGYLAMGGSFALGSFFATIVRLFLTLIVLVVPTVLMGGTLPAVARALERSSDAGRIGVSILYAANALGAVVGVALSTFYLLERFGNLRTLIAAALFNSLIGMAAIAYSNRLRRPLGKDRRMSDEIDEEADRRDVMPMEAVVPMDIPTEAVAPPRFVYAAAAIVGFAFFLMELVWYRLLTPLLGGTTYTFGLILAVALAGIGSGSLFWAAIRRRRATVAAFGVSCAIEAVLLAVPFALGDRLAFVALLSRSLGALGFDGYVLSWLGITAIVVFPAAFVAGLQFPLLISLLGEGRTDVGRHVGAAYLWNTAGAIAGSIAGGFGLLPLLTAIGAWKAAVVLLCLLVIASWMVKIPGHRAAGAGSLAAAALAIALLFAEGPSAFWRHSPIGAGRLDRITPVRNRLIDLQHTRQRTTSWEAEGVESSVSIAHSDGYAFIVNGKSDGHARLDAGTQVMGGLLPAILHPNPKTAVVIGLGTGSTAGWLGAVPSIERLDVVEIEPSIVYMAELSTPVNHDVIHNQKVNIVIGDGREFLLARGQKYDIISSEPSNPYRAGIANLFTTEFYRACQSRLNPGGVFAQFLQAYEVDAPTISTIYATIAGVFPYVETWQTAAGDLLLIASWEPIRHDWRAIEQKMRSDVFHQGIRNAWGVTSVAGFYARYVAGTNTARRLAGKARPNTDDRPTIEYAFARSLGFSGGFDVAELRSAARMPIDDVPKEIRGVAEAAEIEAERLSIGVAHESKIDLHEYLAPEVRNRGVAQIRYLEGGFADAWTIWKGQQGGPRTPLEMITFAETLAERGDSDAMPYLQALRAEFPIEAETLLARLLWRQGRKAEGTAALVRAFEQYRTNPWPLPIVMRRAIRLANEIAEQDRGALAAQVETALRQPFAIEMLRELRRSALLYVQDQLSPESACSDALLETVHSFEPHVPWQEIFLTKRATCYEQRNDPLAKKAAAELREFRRSERPELETSARAPSE
ncbi:MAG: fused MFS/spermidine synthase [Acidobacteriota bacterium]|nr:fused MFS/spermidine synthase [Acidobacteriota bacterium]